MKVQYLLEGFHPVKDNLVKEYKIDIGLALWIYQALGADPLKQYAATHIYVPSVLRYLEYLFQDSFDGLEWYLEAVKK